MIEKRRSVVRGRAGGVTWNADVKIKVELVQCREEEIKPKVNRIRLGTPALSSKKEYLLWDHKPQSIELALKIRSHDVISPCTA